MAWWQGLTSGTRNRHMTRISKKRTVARIRWSKGRRKASATGVKVAGIGTSDVKAKELDSPLAWGAGVVGGSVPTAGAAATECVIGGRAGRSPTRAAGPVARLIRVSVLEERWQWEVIVLFRVRGLPGRGGRMRSWWLSSLSSSVIQNGPSSPGGKINVCVSPTIRVRRYMPR